MPRSATTQTFNHKRIDNTALPYITAASPINTQPHLIAGSNAYAAIGGWMERRPGFPVYTADSYAAPAKIVRFFTWQRWAAAYYTMLCVIDATAVTSKVYKKKEGTDATFVLIHTDSVTAEPFDFCTSNNFLFFGNGTDMKKYDGTTVTNWGISPQPTTAPTFTSLGAGNVPNVINHKYVFAYGVAATGYISDISEESVYSQTVTATVNRSFSVTGARCTDTQCDRIHVYRTEDGGSVFLELSNSPIANPGAGAWTITDNDLDTSLDTGSQAPLARVNSRPTAARGSKLFAGRIWIFAGNTLYRSTLEENTSSVPEECFGDPSYEVFKFGSEILGLGVTKNYLLIFTGSGISRIAGDSLVTFSRSVLSKNLGARNRAAIAEWGDNCVWLDTSNTIRVTDGESILPQDLTFPIRPDIAAIDHSLASLAVFEDGLRRLIVLCDGGAAKLRVFNADLGFWNVPWALSGATCVHTGQTAAGTWKLFLGRSGKPDYMDTTTYQDELTNYAASITTNLFPMVEDNPTGLSDCEYVGIERNAVAPSSLKYLTDEDPSTGTFTAVAAGSIVDPANRTNGTDLVEKWYWVRTPGASRVAVQINWVEAATNFKWYSLDVAYKAMR